MEKALVIQSKNKSPRATQRNDFSEKYCKLGIDKRVITSIHIPSTVENIGKESFEGCIAVQSVNIPPTTTAIGVSAFLGCTSLQHLHIPIGVRAIEMTCFKNCHSLPEIDFPSVKKISHQAFERCSSMAKVSIPSVQEIGNHAFDGCESLISLEFSDSIEKIGDRAFYNCPNLKTLYVKPTTTTAASTSNATIQLLKSLIRLNNDTRLLSSDHIIDQLDGPFKMYKTYTSLPVELRVTPARFKGHVDANDSWARVQLWLWWSKSSKIRCLYSGEVWISSVHRRQIILAFVLSCERCEKTFSLPALPEEIKMIILSFLKWDASPVFVGTVAATVAHSATTAAPASTPAAAATASSVPSRSSPRAARTSSQPQLITRITDRRTKKYTLEYKVFWVDDQMITEQTGWMTVTDLRKCPVATTSTTIDAMMRLLDDSLLDTSSSPSRGDDDDDDAGDDGIDPNVGATAAANVVLDPRIGSRVNVLWKGTMYGATVLYPRPSQRTASYDVEYDDGTFGKNLTLRKYLLVPLGANNDTDADHGDGVDSDDSNNDDES